MENEKSKIVTVIIPTYKRSERLDQAIDSVIKQTYRNIEIIVVDDNNPNSEYRLMTEKTMEKYRDTKNLKYIKHDKNKNGAAARNTGIKNSKGDYIAFLDDDDLYLPSKVEEEVNFLEKNKEYQAVYCGRFQNGLEINGNYTGDLSKVMLSGEFMPTTPALMFRRDAIIDINGFNENFKRHQEVEMLIRFFDKYKIGAIQKPLVSIGVNEGENEVHGVELENNKKLYLETFNRKIKELDKISNGFEKRVFMKHYSEVFCDHLHNKYYKRALNVYIQSTRKSFFIFNTMVLRHVFKYVKMKFLRIKLAK